MTIEYYVFETKMEFEVDPVDFAGCLTIDEIAEGVTLAAKENFSDRMSVKVEALDAAAAAILEHLNKQEPEE